MSNSSYWKKQNLLDYRSRLRKSRKGFPWPAQVFAIIDATVCKNDKDIATLNAARWKYGLTDEEIMILLSAYESGDIENEAAAEVIARRFSKSGI